MAFVPLEKLGRLHDGYKKVFKVDRHNLLLMQLEGKVYLIENRCPHMHTVSSLIWSRAGLMALWPSSWSA